MLDCRFIEATNGPQNWGKFFVMRFGVEEHAVESRVTHGVLLGRIGFSPENIWVLDLQTREGAAFSPGGLAKADLERHRVWVCPLFEPFLEWLYTQDLSDLSKLPRHVDLPQAAFAVWGRRRTGT